MRRAILLAAAFTLAPSARGDEPVEFNRDIRPILAENCFSCHGFDAKARKAKLRLDIPEAAYAERKGIIPIKPGDLDASEVWLRVASDDPDVMMPPPSSKKSLTAAQKKLLRAWIVQGAKYQKHWSFEPIHRPTVPEITNDKSQITNPIDAFLLARLQKEGLKPNAEADRETLVRRVSFALTGLPPTLEEVDRFLADRSPNAYEKMVDRYLASPRFGEEMARHWLDVARYADTHGLHLDNEREMWAYRDWVIRAFNQNLPFDQFAKWQVAGDLLPNPTNDQLTATGFNRCNVTTGEGGSIAEEWVYRNAVDRTSTFASAFLGLTAGCAVCHDHKFDPITSKEYYSLYAFFLSAADPPLDGNVSTTAPFAKLPTLEQQAALDAAAKAEAAARKRLLQAATKAKYDDPIDQKTAKRQVADVLLDDTFPLAATDRNTTRNAASWLTDPSFGAKSGRRVLKQANSFFHQDIITYRLRPYRMPANGAFEAWVYLDPLHPPVAIAVQLGNGKKVRWGTEPDETPYNSKSLGTRIGPVPKPGEWTKLTVSAADLGLKEGQSVPSLTLQEFGGVAYWDAVVLKGEIDPATDPIESFELWWKSLGKKAPPELPADLSKLAAGGPTKKHDAAAVAKLRGFYLSFVARPATKRLKSLQDAWEKTRADHEATDDAIPGTMIFRDLGMPREAFIMTRGQYTRPGDKVRPDVPAVLPPLKGVEEGQRATRLDLANWLMAKENPLTARVAVNRFWQQFFGTGLVRTSGDFGTQGEPPSHPELLDWLASEFMNPSPGPSPEKGGEAETPPSLLGKGAGGLGSWDTKKLVKLMVMSAAFRRDARHTPEIAATDPANRLLARGPRFRLDAEQLRDNALFVSGLIDLKMGGRGVMTYQPPNIWEPLGYGDSNTRYYLQDHGTSLYRHSIYVFIKRTAPHPFLTNFDAPNREQVCTVRERTNTPLQALQLMNDVQHFEAARALAERVLADGGDTTDSRIAYLYRLVLSRKPDAEEIGLVAAALEKQRAIFSADLPAARKVVQTGESKPRGVASVVDTAAWTMIANLVLNLDETLNRN